MIAEEITNINVLKAKAEANRQIYRISLDKDHLEVLNPLSHQKATALFNEMGLDLSAIRQQLKVNKTYYLPDVEWEAADGFRRCSVSALICKSNPNNFWLYLEDTMLLSTMIKALPSDSQSAMHADIHLRHLDYLTNLEKLEKAESNQNELSHIFSASNALIIGFDRSDIVTRWNPTAEKLLGISIDASQKAVFLRLPIKWDWTKVLRLIGEAKSQQRGSSWDQIYYTQPDGSSGYLIISVHPVLDSAGKVLRYFLLGNDITERHRIETRLNLQSKYDALGHLTSGLVHEIIGPVQYMRDNIDFISDSLKPISGILNLSQLLENNYSQSQWQIFKEELKRADSEYLQNELPNALKQIDTGLEQITEHIDSIRFFLNSTPNTLIRYQLNPVIKKLVSICRNEWKYHANITWALSDKLPQVVNHNGDLFHGLLNLMVSTFRLTRLIRSQTTSQKESILISTDAIDDTIFLKLQIRKLHIPLSYPQDMISPLVNLVSDDPHIEQGFWYARDVIVNHHNGHIHVNSSEEEGTLIEVAFRGNNQLNDKEN